MTPLLEVEGLSAGYGRMPVLHQIDLTIEPGSITTVLGANGAGKTTFLRALSRLLPLSGGSVRLGGKDLSGVPVEDLVRLGMTHVPEGRGVITELTVEENLRLGGMWRGRGSGAETERAMAEVYELFEPLARRRKNSGHQLSGGERQMLALGRALVARPSLLLLDEPSLGLAPPVTARIMALLRTLREKTGIAVLLVEQNVTSALDVADEGVVIALGRIVARGRADELQADEGLRHAYLGF
jgi:branched-chain amino acid transport system ATP-binding protein